MMEAGIAYEVITPVRGVPLAGYFDPRPNTGALDDLKVKVILLKDGEVKTGFVTFDLCFITAELVKDTRSRLAAAGIDFAGNLIFHATHTHTGPYAGEFFSYPADPAYLNDLADAACRAVVRASGNFAPAELSFAKTHENPLAFNRRYWMKDGTVVTNPGKCNKNIVKPEGPVDDEITVMVIRQDGRISAVMANIVNHSDTIGGDFVSADWPGRMEKYLQLANGSDIMVSTVIGCSGNINHFDIREPGNQTGYEEACRIGAAYAEIVGKLMAQAEAEEGALSIAGETVEIPSRVMTEEQVAEAEKIMKETENLDESAAMTSEGLAAGAGPVLRFFAKELIAFQKNWAGKIRSLEFRAIHIGNAFAAVSFPGEPFTQIGLAVKEVSPAKYNFMVSLAMDEAGYVCMEECYTRGGYEPRPITGAGLAYNAAGIYMEVGKKLIR